MPTIIDSLLVTLGLDSSKFEDGKTRVKKGLGETGNEADKTSARLKKTGKEGGDSFKNIAVNAAKFLAIVGGTAAIKRFAEQLIESNAGLDRLSKNLQENISTISAWSNSTELAGGTAEGLQGTLDMLSRAQTELQLTGQSTLIPYFSALGVSIADASGKSRAGADVLLDLADRFSKMDRTTANNMGRMMGIDAGTMNLLLRGRKEVELMVARQKEHNVVTKKQGEESSRLRATMIEGRQSFEAFGRELLSSATPAIEGLFAIMKDFGEWMRENKEFVNAFLTVIAVGLAAIAVATIPINLTVVAVLALAAAIAALWQDYQVWKRGGDSFIDWGKWEPGFKAAGAGIKWLKDLLGDLVYRAIAGADVLSAVFDRDWERVKFAAGEFVNGNGKKYGSTDEPLPPMPTPPKPSTVSTAPAASVAPTQQGAMSQPVRKGAEQSEQQAVAFFQSQGWTKAQAVGIAANIKRESEFKADAVGDNGQAYGIAQWHPDRQGEFKKQFGKDIKGSSIAEQMAFIQFELTQGAERKAGDKLRAATTAEDAAAAVSTHYERPADKEGEAMKRRMIASLMMRKDVPSTQVAEQPKPAQSSDVVEQPKPASTVLKLVSGIPNATQAAQGSGAPNVAAANAPNLTQDMSKSVETHIGEIKVYTAATDAAGIANDMSKSMDFLFQSQANYGLT